MKHPRFAVLGILLLVTSATPAAAVVETEPDPQPLSLEDRVDAIVEANPGSHQVSPTEVEIQDGVVVGVPVTDADLEEDPSLQTHTNSDCFAGWVCFFEHAGYQGHVLKLFRCDPVVDLRPIDMTGAGIVFWDHEISSWIDVQTGGAFARLYTFPPAPGQPLTLLNTTNVPRAEDFVGANNDRAVFIDPC